MLTPRASSQLDTEYGIFDIHVFEDADGKEHVALVSPWKSKPLVRIHSKCLTGDTFGSRFCDCRLQLHGALQRIHEVGGVVVYLDQEGRGLGLSHKIQAYELQRKGMDTVEADEHLGKETDQRAYEIAAEILRFLEIRELDLLTNNPAKVDALKREGFHVERLEHVVDALSERGKKYQQTKKEKMGHLFKDEDI